MVATIFVFCGRSDMFPPNRQGKSPVPERCARRLLWAARSSVEPEGHHSFPSFGSSNISDVPFFDPNYRAPHSRMASYIATMFAVGLTG